MSYFFTIFVRFYWDG